MARVKTLMTHNNPAGCRRDIGEVYETTEYQMLCDKCIVEMASADDKSVVKEVVEPVDVEEDESPPSVANKQMGSESQDKESKSGKGGGRKYKRRDMTAEG